MEFRVLVGVPTFKRRAMLFDLLESLQSSLEVTRFEFDFEILVADNDPAGSAREVVESIKGSFGHRIYYHIYVRKGLAAIRNFILEFGFSGGYDYLVFIDDDEYVTCEWMNELLEMMLMNDVVGVRGPVIPVFSDEVAIYIKWIMKRKRYKDGEKLDNWTTGNLIVDLKYIRANSVLFDERFNSIGAEDTFFGREMNRKGATLVWADNAVVYERIVDQRANMVTCIRRQFSSSAVFVFILRMERMHLSLVRKFVISAI